MTCPPLSELFFFHIHANSTHGLASYLADPPSNCVFIGHGKCNLQLFAFNYKAALYLSFTANKSIRGRIRVINEELQPARLNSGTHGRQPQCQKNLRRIANIILDKRLIKANTNERELGFILISCVQLVAFYLCRTNIY